MRLTFYLFKEEIKDYKDALLVEKFEGDNRYKDVTLKDVKTDFDYRIFLQRNVSKSPRWLGFIDQYAEIEDKEDLKNQVNSFVILISKHDRFFAITGGFGFHALDKEKTESNFGLIVALNSIDEEAIKFVDVKNIDTNTKQKRIITSLNLPIREFDLDFNKDLLRIISGAPLDSTLAKTIKGSDSLTLSGDLKFEKLGQKCDQLLSLYQDKKYKENYGFIDNILPVKNAILEENLDSILIEKLYTLGEDKKINITYPDQFDYEKCELIKIFGLSENIQVENLTLSGVYEFFSKIERFDIKTLKKRMFVIGLDADDNAITSKVPLYNFFSFETEYQNSLYVLSNKQWFEVSKDYILTLESELSDIEYVEGYLPNYKHKNELDYNKNVASSVAGFVLFDRKNIKPKMGGKIEVCDLFKTNGKAEFIHIKKDYASSSLSHLFAQGTVSLELLISDLIFKQNFEKELGSSFNSSQNIIVSYGIISKKQGNLIKQLPVFSKVHLLTHVKRIKLFQAQPRVIKIYREN